MNFKRSREQFFASRIPKKEKTYLIFGLTLGLGSVAAVNVGFEVTVLLPLVEEQTGRADLLYGGLVPAVEVVSAAPLAGELAPVGETTRGPHGLVGLATRGPAGDLVLPGTAGTAAASRTSGTTRASTATGTTGTTGAALAGVAPATTLTRVSSAAALTRVASGASLSWVAAATTLAGVASSATLTAIVLSTLYLVGVHRVLRVPVQA